MKKKQLNILLITLVTTVWGTICYRVIMSLTGSEDDLPVETVAAPREQVNDYAIRADTAKLKLNYPDPFLGKRVDTPTTIQKIRQATSKSHTQLATSVLNWSAITYDGFIKGPDKRLTALLRHNGKAITLNEGESEDDIKLIRNLRDSVKISYGGQTRTIKINYQQ